MRGATVAKILASVPLARQAGLTLPVLAMVSFSIIFKHGTREFAQALAQAGLDGVILPDIPLEEAPAVVQTFHDADITTSLLVAPTTPAPRRAQIASLCNAFVYYLSISGITGERQKLPADIAQNVAALRALTPVPICVGFGISTAAQVRQVTAVADGAIVGSALLRRLTDHLHSPPAQLASAVENFVRELAAGAADSPPA